MLTIFSSQGTQREQDGHLDCQDRDPTVAMNLGRPAVLMSQFQLFPSMVNSRRALPGRAYRNGWILHAAGALTGLQRAAALPGRVTTKCPGHRAGSLTG